MKGERLLELVALVDRLRGPGGCPWDREQTFDTLKPMMLEEAYEVLDAMDSGDRQEFASELGDLLFQVVFLSRVAEDEGSFHIDEVAQGIISKMIRRHPHVFGAVNASTADEVVENWETIKRAERAGRPGTNETGSPAVHLGRDCADACAAHCKQAHEQRRRAWDSIGRTSRRFSPSCTKRSTN